MMARIPFGVPNTVPWWQLGLSMALLIIGFIFTVWFAAKNLPYRYINVWQKAKLERNAPRAFRKN